MTGDRVTYLASQAVARDYPEIPSQKFAETVVFLDAERRPYYGAEAVFRTLATVPGKGGWLWAYRKLPWFRGLAEVWYQKVARGRPFFSRWTRWLYGSSSAEEARMGTVEGYRLTRRVFLSALGLVYLMAFLSLGVQIRGLMGERGILPVAEFLSAAREHFGETSFWRFPSLFWWITSDAALQGVCWAGAALSVLLVWGLAPVFLLLLLWFLYLSLFSVGHVFLGYQWDVLLLEVGFLAIFWAPWSFGPRGYRNSDPSKMVVWLTRWLLFRLMFSSAWVKYFSGDPTWRDLSALEYHYQTQPLPTWIAYYLQQLPPWFQHASTVGMYFVEGVVPFFFFAPRRLRLAAAWITIGFQVFLLLSGNYGFFNWLGIALCFSLFDDAAWPRWMRRRFFSPKKIREGGRSFGWPRWITAPLALLLVFLSMQNLIFRLKEVEARPWVQKIASFFAPYQLVGSYGLFAVMTKTRGEITVEGSRDGKEWKAYVFRYKPGDLKRRPRFVAPHQPRLDWQMWFAALAPFRTQIWFQVFLFRLLEGAPEVLALLQENPFPEGPPSFVRAKISDYEFTTWKEKQESGNWWKRGPEEVYAPALRLR
jgi:predicted DCC family thiol-disulfide oxidoreductase YuxK